MKYLPQFVFALLTATALAPAQAAENSYNLVGSGGKCLDSSGGLAPCGGVEQRFVFAADGAVMVDTGQGMRYLRGRLFSSKSVDFSDAPSTGASSTFWTQPGGDRLQLAQTGSATPMCLSLQSKAGATRGSPAVLSAELALCSASAANQKWQRATPLPLGAAGSHQTQLKSVANRCLQQSDFNAPLAPGKLAVSACASVAKNEYFTFTNQGAIMLNGLCLSASGAAVGSGVGLGSCGEIGVPPGDLQKWKRAGNSRIVSASNGLCLGIANRSTQDKAAVDLETCDASNPFQTWITGNTLASDWQGPDNKPTTYVPGQKLSNGQVNTIVNWIQSETSITSTPFCYKTAAYDRGVGILPACGDGQYQDGALCYSDCRSGYHPVGSVCWSNQALSYQPGNKCTHRDALGTCWAWKMNDCKDGYTSDGLATCWLNNSSYQNGAGSLLKSCKSNRVLQAGLCYLKPHDGYQCNATSCNQRCAAGIVDCGAAACASNANQCANTITNMVVSSAMMIGSFASGGTMGVAKSSVMTAKNAYMAATTAYDLAQALLALSENINNFMNLAENNLASISSTDIEAQIAAKYKKGDADYRHIAREWAARQMMFYIADLLLDLDTLIITSIDPTGITGVIDAFAKPPCKDHTPMP